MIRLEPALQTVVIFRLGSLGDTVVSLPCFHQIRRAFPKARKVLLTNFPVSSLAAPAETVLRGGGFIDGSIYYQVGERRWSKLTQLRRQLRDLDSTTFIYLTEGRSLLSNYRDIAFFWLCGFRRFIGAPLTRDRAHGRIDPRSGDVEREAERLARCMAPLGPIDVRDPTNWDLRLTSEEIADADRFSLPIAGTPFIAINTGGKVQAKDWGADNWEQLLSRVSLLAPDHALVVLGAVEDEPRAEHLSQFWSGPFLSACGRLSPRESAALLRRGRLFIGHDSGPLHLAAAMGLPCVSMFGENNRPKKWHPIGPQHRILHDMAGVMAISPDAVFQAVREVLGDTAP